MSRKKAPAAEEKKRELSLTDTAVFLEYLQCWNATEAWKRVHKRAKRESAMRLGSRWLRKVEVQEAIKEQFKATPMDADEVLGRLADQARASHEPFVRIADGFVYFDFSDPRAKENLHLIKKIKTRRQRQIIGRGKDESAKQWEHEWVEVELHDQQRALELIGKHLKLFTDKFEIDHRLNVENLDEVLDRIYGSDDTGG